MGIPPLTLLVLLVSVVASARAEGNSTATSASFHLPSDCPKSCGNITFDYPFGIGHGCFRSGFELTCKTINNGDQSGSRKLFLGDSSSAIEITYNISAWDASLVANTPFATMNINENSSYASWTAPANAPYFFSTDNSLWVFGCSAVGSVVDLTSNQILATCNTTCADDSSTDQDSCDGVRCCSVPLKREVQSYGIRLTRKNHTSAANDSSVKAFIWRSNSATLIWKINYHRSCEEAKKEMRSYACLSENSICKDGDSSNISAGYHCFCPPTSSWRDNPYVPNGCHEPPVTALPSANCSSKCGNVRIPFPFGLEEGCYRDKSFAISCNETAIPAVPDFNGQVVTRIMEDEGQVEVVVPNPRSYDTFDILQQRATFNWTIEFKSCAKAELIHSKSACLSSNNKCVNTYIQEFPGYKCKCSDGFQGNPYLPDGCTDIDECLNPQIYVCFGECVNTVGSYSCSCPSGMTGDPKKRPCVARNKELLGIIIGVCLGFGTLLIVPTSIFATWKWKKMSQKRIRRKNFDQNHGLLLQQFIVSSKDDAEQTKVFSLEELEKATNNFDISKILGDGGHGTVYKEILSDQRVVAIKQSKVTVKREIDQFINEVVVLSQINHRNIVKLYGCCLETEVSLLVYEFISNGTLYYHLHNRNRKSCLSWKDRLRIAREITGALAYLHSYASISIFHRDMKSSNILLDEYYTAKVSDFGTSRFIPLDQTHIFTSIQGTFGYLDSEYYRTWKLTEKSDVYNFGVILLELLTGEKPISFLRSEEEGNLIMQFLRAIKDNHQFELIEARVIEEEIREEIAKVTKIIETCLKLKGSERPTMREVEVQLKSLTRVEDILNDDQEIQPLH